MPNHVIVCSLNWSEQPLEAAIGTIAALDFGQVDLALHEGWAHVSPSALADGGADRVMREVERIQALIAEHRMKRISALHVDLGKNNIAAQQRRLAAVSAFGRALGASVMTLMSAPLDSPLAAEVHRLNALVPVAAEHGVQVAVQTHRHQLTALPSMAVQLCEQVTGLGVTLDASHLYAGPNKGADYSSLLPLVRHVHLRDATLEHLQVPAGTGSVDVEWIVSRLHAIGYGGKFAIKYIDRVPTLAPGGESTDPATNTIRMRDVFVAAERRAGIVRAPAVAPV